VNTNNGVNWRRFIVPKIVEQINDHLFANERRIDSLKARQSALSPALCTSSTIKYLTRICLLTSQVCRRLADSNSEVQRASFIRSRLSTGD